MIVGSPFPKRIKRPEIIWHNVTVLIIFKEKETMAGGPGACVDCDNHHSEDTHCPPNP